MTTGALIGLIVGLGIPLLIVVFVLRPMFRIFERVLGLFGGAQWTEQRARDELAGLTDAINAVDVQGAIGADPVKAGHYERAIDVRDQAERALDRSSRGRDLRQVKALIKESRRELSAAGGAVSGAALGGALAWEVSAILKERSPAMSSTAARPPDAADITAQLGRLANLRDRGVITQAELEAQKQKLLDA